MAKQPLMAITLHRPWPYAVIELGKWIENRTWSCNLPVGSLIAIHAGQKWDWEGAEWINSQPSKTWGELPPEDEHPTGIVAIATYGGMVTESDSFWFTGPIGFVLHEVMEFPQPVLCRGQQRLWRVPDVVLPEAREQYMLAMNGRSKPAKTAIAEVSPTPCDTVDGAIAWFEENRDRIAEALPLRVPGSMVYSIAPLERLIGEYRADGSMPTAEHYIRRPIDRICWVMNQECP